jgi:hypothetical protein
MIIPTEVLKVVSIFMKYSTDHTLNGGGIIPVYKDGPDGTIISTIGGDTFIPKCTDRIVNHITLGPKVLLTPSNGLPNHTTNLCGGHGRGGGLEVCLHEHNFIMVSPKVRKKYHKINFFIWGKSRTLLLKPFRSHPTYKQVGVHSPPPIDESRPLPPSGETTIQRYDYLLE